ncbi:glycosyltransferase family 4 protein [Vibrio fluvialis]|uniref:glycosyltransferase family 4 protein n=1 Tax=Vibrio fluvialis TaxID=676 RepID=UPI001EEB0BD2|nr:glycosyltransferase family 4 protein [Vibrio fluvialis]MCG6390971.1 glycosyltransferase family 4 protein [Vibrio fluvialis]MCG6421379.1 glycosyltransferase family 4 protein [Vibrio fluvialis]
MKITVLGTRGIPDVLGGVETHCQHLYPQLVKQFGAEVCVIARSPYVPYQRSSYEGVQTKAIWAPKKKSLEAIVHSTLAAFSTLFDGSDVVHVHAIGPGLVVPLLRLLGKKVVFTHHGPDYDRQKWGGFAKKVLMLGEKFAAKWANEVIVISEVINRILQQKYQRFDANLIYNGVLAPVPLSADIISTTLSQYQLTPQNYMVAVGRFVEEKGFHDLIDAYRDSGLSMLLVLVGDTDHETPYSAALKEKASTTPGVILTGFLKGDALKAVFSQARLFVMPSYHEGLPIALLEAMSFSLPAIVSDIPANSEVALDTNCYFPVGDVSALSHKLAALPEETHVDYSEYLAKYDWQKIAQQTMQVYQKVVGRTV